MSAPTAPRTPAAWSHTKVTREDWLAVAVDTLVVEGVESVKILTLARKLGVSRSSFYWYFKSRQDLLDRLLQFWSDTNTRGIVAQAGKPSGTITQGVLNVFECWVDERVYDPRLDFAVREWARRSEPIRRRVMEADDARVAAIRDLYMRHGFSEMDAFIRARVLYFMQIGYYALDLNEAMETRLSYLPAYLRSFTGEEPREADMERFRKQSLVRPRASA